MLPCCQVLTHLVFLFCFGGFFSIYCCCSIVGFHPVEWKAAASVKWRWNAVEMLWYRLQQIKQTKTKQIVFDLSLFFTACHVHVYQYRNVAPPPPRTIKIIFSCIFYDRQAVGKQESNVNKSKLNEFIHLKSALMDVNKNGDFYCFNEIAWRFWDVTEMGKEMHVKKKKRWCSILQYDIQKNAIQKKNYFSPVVALFQNAVKLIKFHTHTHSSIFKLIWIFPSLTSKRCFWWNVEL